VTHLFQNLVVALVAFGLAFWCGGARARAETPQSAPVLQLLRNDAALRAWLVERNRQVGAASARVDQAYADLGASRLLAPNPSLDFGVSDLVVGTSNAVVVVGGTISAALLTLVVLPVTYYWAMRARDWWTARRAALAVPTAEPS